MSKTFGVVLAAGKGTRMKTELPKCAYPILKKPMIEYIVEKLERTVIDETVVVVGHQKEVLMDILEDIMKIEFQKCRLIYFGAAIDKAGKQLLNNRFGFEFLTHCTIGWFFVHPGLCLIDLWIVVREFKAGI